MQTRLMRWTRFLTKISAMFFLLCIAASGMVSGAKQDDPDEKRTRLQQLQQQLKEKHGDYEQIESKEQNLAAELHSIDQVLKTYQQQLQESRNALENNTKELKKIQHNLIQLQEKHKTKKAILADRLRTLYKMGDLGYLNPILAMSSYDNMQQQIKYLQRIAESDVKLLNEAEKDIQVILRQKNALEKRKQEIVRAQKAIKQQQARIHAQKQQKDQLLQDIRKDKHQFAQVIKRLEASATELEQLLDTLDTIPREIPSRPRTTNLPEKNIVFPTNAEEVVQSYGKHFRANKGKLLWPVQGKIITNFGNIRIGETFTFYKGVDIKAQGGTPFYAVFKGIVKYADWFEGYGNLIILDHGGNFYTLYAHADEIVVKPGDVIEARQLLGKVGDTDSIKGDHLYFEVRANGKPVNPQLWLAKVQ